MANFTKLSADNVQYSVARHLRKIANADSYSRRVTDVPGWTNYATGEIHEPRRRRRAVNRRVRRMQGSRGFVSVNDGPAAAVDIARVIGNFVRNHLEGDFFEPTPDHHPRPVGALHEDFYRAQAAKPNELVRTELNHARRRILASGDPLGPRSAGGDSDSGVFGWGNGFADVLGAHATELGMTEPPRPFTASVAAALDRIETIRVEGFRGLLAHDDPSWSRLTHGPAAA